MAFKIKAGDTEPALRAVCKDALGKNVNLTGATVTFNMKPRPGCLGIPIRDGVCVVNGDPTKGDVSYVWLDGDTDTPGLYHGEFRATWSPDRVESIPNEEYIDIEILPGSVEDPDDIPVQPGRLLSAWVTGTGPPDDDDGQRNDYYLQSDGHVWGPKGVQGWPDSPSFLLRGVQGPVGDPGPILYPAAVGTIAEFPYNGTVDLSQVGLASSPYAVFGARFRAPHACTLDAIALEFQPYDNGTPDDNGYYVVAVLDVRAGDRNVLYQSARLPLPAPEPSYDTYDGPAILADDVGLALEAMQEFEIAVAFDRAAGGVTLVPIPAAQTITPGGSVTVADAWVIQFFGPPPSSANTLPYSIAPADSPTWVDRHNVANGIRLVKALSKTTVEVAPGWRAYDPLGPVPGDTATLVPSSDPALVLTGYAALPQGMCISPDGSKLILTPDGTRVVVRNADGSGVDVNLANNAVVAWLDNNTIVQGYTPDSGVSWKVSTIHADGTNAHDIITGLPHIVNEVRATRARGAGGGLIAVNQTHDNGPHYRLFFVDLTGAITFDDGGGGQDLHLGGFTAAGDEFVYSGGGNGQYGIISYQLDVPQSRNVFGSVAYKCYDPVLSPDDTEVFFVNRSNPNDPAMSVAQVTGGGGNTAEGSMLPHGTAWTPDSNWRLLVHPPTGSGGYNNRIDALDSASAQNPVVIDGSDDPDQPIQAVGVAVDGYLYFQRDAVDTTPRIFRCPLPLPVLVEPVTVDGMLLSGSNSGHVVSIGLAGSQYKHLPAGWQDVDGPLSWIGPAPNAPQSLAFSSQYPVADMLQWYVPSLLVKVDPL